jgi:hypothetical protein
MEALSKLIILEKLFWKHYVNDFITFIFSSEGLKEIE